MTENGSVQLNCSHFLSNSVFEDSNLISCGLKFRIGHILDVEVASDT